MLMIIKRQVSYLGRSLARDMKNLRFTKKSMRMKKNTIRKK